MEDGKEIITVFDSASTITLVLREVIERKALKITLKGTTQCINGIGGKTLSEEGELIMTRSDGTQVKANVNIADDIITTKKQDRDTARRLAHYNAKILILRFFNISTSRRFYYMPCQCSVSVIFSFNL